MEALGDNDNNPDDAMNANEEDEEEEREIDHEDRQKLMVDYAVSDLLRNNPHMTEHIGQRYSLNDEGALRIAEALTRNRYLKIMEITLDDDMTARGARVIMNGLKRSRVTDLRVKTNYNSRPRPPVLNIVLEEAIQAMRSLHLDFSMNNDDAISMGAALLLRNNLQSLTMDIAFSSVTEDGAHPLAAGILASNLEKLELKKENPWTSNHQVMRIILTQAAKRVKELALSYRNGLSYDDAMLLKEAMLGNCTLQYVSLCLPPSVHLPEAGAMVLADAICQSQITCLKLTGPLGMPDDDDNRTIQIIYEGVRRAPALRHLSLGRGISEAAALAACLPQLHSLEISSTFMDIPTLAVGLRSASQLTTLKCLATMPQLSAHDVLSLSAAIPHLPSLTFLSIQGNLTCEDGDLPHRESRFVRKDFDPDTIRAVAAEQLMVSLANNPRLIHLDLSNNTDIHWRGLEMVGRHLPNVRFKELSLNGYYSLFDYSTTTEEQDRARKQAFQALAAGLRANLHLKVINCESHSPIMEEINFYLQLNQCGRYLLHLDDDLAPAVWCRVLAKCQKSSKRIDVIYYFLREQPALLYAAAARTKQSKRRSHDQGCLPANRRLLRGNYFFDLQRTKNKDDQSVRRGRE